MQVGITLPRLRLMTLACLAGLQGCAVVAVADAGISVAATAVKVTANVVGAAVDGVASVAGGADRKK